MKKKTSSKKQLVLPRLTARIYKVDKRSTGIPYVLMEDIVKFHGREWAEKYAKKAGVNTCVSVPAKDPSHGMPAAMIGIYLWDYKRFADVVDLGTPTIFD